MVDLLEVMAQVWDSLGVTEQALDTELESLSLPSLSP
jgi:hypothetical protein